MPRAINSLDDVFALIEKAAIAGERCPKTKPFGPINDGSATTMLARDGKIRIEIYPHNFRRVTILVGEHAGKTTANPPNKNWRPYKTIGQDHTRTSYRRIAP